MEEQQPPDVTAEKKAKQPPRFHTPGMRWHFSDGVVMAIGEDGAARRTGHRVRMSKKARRRAKRAGK